MRHIISLGAGVQSSTMALMAAAGVIVPMPECAIFADTQAEPASVYEHLKWLESVLPFPVHRVTAGNLKEQIIAATRGARRMDARPPFFTAGGGMLRRQCTQDYKLIPITRQVRALLGLKRGARGPREPVVCQWIGISFDEATRMKPSRLTYVEHRWPLVEMQFTRAECLAYLAERAFPTPPKSACTFCPYHDNALWRDMKANDPASRAIRHGVGKRKDGRPSSSAEWFLHASRQPLEDVDFRTAEDAGQTVLFQEECEGMCGV